VRERATTPELALPNTLLLLASSAVVIRAERGISRGARARPTRGLLIALVLGIVFLAIKGIEYSRKDLGQLGFNWGQTPLMESDPNSALLHAWSVVSLRGRGEIGW